MNWIAQALEKQDQQYKIFNRQAELAARAIPFNSKPPGWIFEGREISCVPDVKYPWNPKVVKAIQKIAPDIVPIWVRYIYKEPYDTGTYRTHIFGRHGLAAINKAHRVSSSADIRPAIPSRMYEGVKLNQPNQLEIIFKGGDDPRAKDLPGRYVPFDWDIYRFVKENYRKHTVKSLRDHFINDPRARYEARKQQELEQKAYQMAILQAYWQKKLNSATEVETKEYFLGVGSRKKEVKPTVDLGSKK